MSALIWLLTLLLTLIAAAGYFAQPEPTLEPGRVEAQPVGGVTPITVP